MRVRESNRSNEGGEMSWNVREMKEGTWMWRDDLSGLHFIFLDGNKSNRTPDMPYKE